MKRILIISSLLAVTTQTMAAIIAPVIGGSVALAGLLTMLVASPDKVCDHRYEPRQVCENRTVIEYSWEHGRRIAREVNRRDCRLVQTEVAYNCRSVGQMNSKLFGLGALTLVGGLLLDEQSNKIEFRELSKDQALKLNLADSDVLEFNQSVDTLNLIANEASLSKTADESALVWSQAKDSVIGEGTQRVMKEILSQH